MVSRACGSVAPVCIPSECVLDHVLPQTKDTMTLKVSSFGSKCELPDTLLKKIAACGIMELVTSTAQLKEQRGLKKGDGAKRSRLVGEPHLKANSPDTPHLHCRSDAKYQDLEICKSISRVRSLHSEKCRLCIPKTGSLKSAISCSYVY